MNQQDRDREREIAERASELFADSMRSVDGETRSKLAQARAKAVEAAGSRRRFWSPLPSSLVPLGGVAAAALAVALIWQGPAVEPGSMETAVLNNLDILLEGEDLDLLQELDFYAWLLEQPELLEGGEAANGSG